MMHICFFVYLFLQRLPREVRILLSNDDVSNMQAIVEKADGLITYHWLQSQDLATVAAGDSAAAVKKNVGKKRGGSQPKAEAAEKSFSIERCSPLCWLHICLGNKARCCEQLFALPAVEN
jgi:hypothetical protein